MVSCENCTCAEREENDEYIMIKWSYLRHLQDRVRKLEEILKGHSDTEE